METKPNMIHSGDGDYEFCSIVGSIELNSLQTKHKNNQKFRFVSIRFDICFKFYSSTVFEPLL
jgi:hypothetical protein